MDVAIACPGSRYKALESSSNYKYSSLPPDKNNFKEWLDHFWPRLINIDQGGARGGAIVAPNPRLVRKCNILKTFCQRL